MKILVLGAGGIGGYFGGRLAEAGVDTTFLVRGKRHEQLARDGLVVESPLGNLELAVKTVTADPLRSPAPAGEGSEEGGYDFVLFTCKAYDLDSAMDAVAPAMRGGATLVPMLNGISHFDRLDARFGKGNVLGGTCQINATLRRDGTVVHGDPLQKMIFGERDRTKSARVEAFALAVSGSKIDGQLSEDIEQDLWEKVVFLSALAAATTLFRGNVREIMAAPGGREAMERVLAGNIAIAAAEGHAPREVAIDRARKRLTDPEGLWSASMLRDLEGGGQVEADHVVGYMLGLARKHALDDTILSLAYTHLKAYEARRAANRLPG